MWLNFVVVYMLVKVQEIHMGNLSEKRAKIILLLTSDWSGFSGYSVPRGWYFVSCNQMMLSVQWNIFIPLSC